MANLLVDRDDRLSVTIIVMKLPVDTKIGPHSNNNSPVDSRINFEWSKSPNSFMVNFIDSQKAPVRDAVSKITKSSCKIAGFVVDMFCTPMIDVADELGIPSYIFYTCGAATLGLFLHLQGLNDEHNQDLTEYENSDAAISVPTYVNPVPAKVWPSIVFEKESAFPNFLRKFRETKGIIINTFLEFEPHAIKALSDDEKIPPVYPVGPIVQTDNDNKNHDEIIKWLDEQPDLSVVFICFGSTGSFERDQVSEIAVALENSGKRFLWSLRKPPPKDKLEFPGEYENHGDVLPDGFLERTMGIGKVIGWAPQMAVLSHPAVGGFVSHCGWNSILESVWCNVPVAAWPLAAEQQANAFQLVKEYEMGVEIKMDYRKRKDCINVIVPAEKIEKAIREMMGTENEGRAKVKALSEKSRMVMTEGESSYDFLGRFIDNFFNNVC
ncbi:putative UDP-glucose flavonoid 3-o-glucosyltransferase 3 [Phtheirospermum japonicum]|uniref:Glycosyltransferase n=1 Tax=Phtheirospermum japonicum TaxID=374723 RepID=A0A830CBR2_9LAMI|nr:putative UDP-glucose flavonoid 3-o-glucosyltransferase 3 [Phtheirospermum japonicum]